MTCRTNRRRMPERSTNPWHMKSPSTELADEIQAVSDGIHPLSDKIHPESNEIHPADPISPTCRHVQWQSRHLHDILLSELSEQLVSVVRELIEMEQQLQFMKLLLEIDDRIRQTEIIPRNLCLEDSNLLEKQKNQSDQRD
ncbi:hypothetical protein GE107_05615 [Cohnella sp. CFH 77786]|uniref:hypothetical protein n=1 Tax=Cohnella sp. CFH 77786 TaxID=2662265 RepID=UPI001C60AD04|nr:hypothetical protein [Cohnella sp. CFH 77786]MBW5445540.1 hypothetical protein [Cohnella sp. CFH 77786]